jgi:hypothetical protein
VGHPEVRNHDARPRATEAHSRASDPDAQARANEGKKYLPQLPWWCNAIPHAREIHGSAPTQGSRSPQSRSRCRWPAGQKRRGLHEATSLSLPSISNQEDSSVSPIINQETRNGQVRRNSMQLTAMISEIWPATMWNIKLMQFYLICSWEKATSVAISGQWSSFVLGHFKWLFRTVAYFAW